MKINSKKLNKISGIIGLIWGTIFTPIAILLNKNLITDENILATFIVSILFLIGGVYLLIKSRRME
ncbi:hypothetical protein JEZ13_04965 [bacterium]|nr:hypothetical protein [bacterium]